MYSPDFIYKALQKGSNMSKFIDLTGQKFGRLTVLERVQDYISSSGRHFIRWKCICDCPNKTEIIVLGNNLRQGDTTSCKCIMKEKPNFLKHRKRNTRLYVVWQNIKSRCYNPNNIGFKYYGAEGKTVCDEWKDNFQAFYDWAMANGYQENLTIERIDRAKGYSPENCRWATPKEQANNKRNNRLITCKGETHTLAEWVEITGINRETIKSRLKSNWSIEKALNTP